MHVCLAIQHAHVGIALATLADLYENGRGLAMQLPRLTECATVAARASAWGNAARLLGWMSMAGG